MLMLSKCHVACNIYLSAGLPVYRAALERLLAEAQREQRIQEAHSVMVVDAFVDTHYDRTSFHLAGSPSAIASLATSITSSAMQVLAPLKKNHQRELVSDDAISDQKQLEHPTVGIVDHISVLPLSSLGGNNNDPQMTWDEWRAYCNESRTENGENTAIHTNNKPNLPDFGEIVSHQSQSMPSSSVPSGWVAWTIGWNLVHQEHLPVNVLYYGHAHPTEKPLAEVRRERTNFFRSAPKDYYVGTAVPAELKDATIASMGQCTIGAPPHFVENYNLRLTSKSSKKLARSLTKAVREKDGGLPFVEALTLPYGSQDRFEVACNLLNPSVTSSKEVDAKVAQFFWKEQKNLNAEEYMEVAYRVGTTEQQCLQVLEDCGRSMEQVERHDASVRQRLQACFPSDAP
ncbi:MAG: hypothetical protein SGBAC_007908 [Bacillariaceae sp.]